MPEKTPEELAAEEAAAAAADEGDDDFDKDRALATIKKQRASERKLKSDLAAAKEDQAELAAIKKAQEDADKSASDKLAGRDARIAELETKIQESAVKADFEKVAEERGIADLALAYLAAKEQGLLGTADPKTGEVGDHDLDKLEELYPALAGEGAGDSGTGDAGVRGKQGKTGTVGSQFNAAVRQKASRR